MPFLRCGGTHERARKPVSSFWSATQECNMCFLLIPSLIPQKRRKKRNACSLLNTSYNVVTKQFILKICIQYKFFQIGASKIEIRCSSSENTFNFGHCNTKISYYKKYFLKKNLIQLHVKKKQKKKDKKKVYMESKTVMLINSVLMTTLILCRN